MKDEPTPSFLRLYKYMTFATFYETLRLGGLRGTFARQSVNLMEFMPASGINQESSIEKELHSHALVSFCRNAESPALWGLYANRGRDICLVFSFPIEHRDTRNLVVPTPEANQTEAVSISTYTLTNGRILREVMYDHNRFDKQITRFNLHELLTHKSTSWKQEEEVRYIGHVDDFDEIAYFNDPIIPYIDRYKPLCKWPMEYLRGALLGPECELSADFVRRQIIQAFPTLSNLLKVESTTYDESEYKIVALK